MPTITYTDVNKTGCCPVPNVKDWNNAEVVWKNKKFIKDKTFNIFHIPVNMGAVMTRMWKKVQDAKAAPPTREFMLLTFDTSPWGSEQFMSTTKDVPEAQNVTLSGRFLTKVFEGPYQDAPKWFNTMTEYVKAKGEKLEKIYAFYTTCPKCAKVYGKNYTVLLAKVDD